MIASSLCFLHFCVSKHSDLRDTVMGNSGLISSVWNQLFNAPSQHDTYCKWPLIAFRTTGDALLLRPDTESMISGTLRSETTAALSHHVGDSVEQILETGPRQLAKILQTYTQLIHRRVAELRQNSVSNCPFFG